MKDKNKSFISAVIYLHNNELVIPAFLSLLYGELQEHFEHFEIICVDDASVDRSLDVVRAAAADMEQATLNILHMSYFHGMELAMDAGCDIAIGDYVYEFDSVNMDYDKDMILRIYEEAMNGYDLVSASPDGTQKLTSSLFYRILNMGSSRKYSMRTETFRIISRRLINRVGSMNRTVPYRKVVYAASGLPMKTVLYMVRKTERCINDRELNGYRRGLALDTLILFTDWGYLFAVRMTMLMMLITVLTGIYTVAVYAIGHPIEGWTTTMLFMAFAFFGLFGILTIMVKYLSIIVDLVFKRQRYMVEGIEKITR